MSTAEAQQTNVLERLDAAMPHVQPGIGLTCAEIAKHTGLCRKTINAIERRALRKLQRNELLQAYAED